jgi:competence protein ComFC
MNITLDSIFGLLAPNLCIACGAEGSVLCIDCLETAGEPVVPRCVGCHAVSDDFKTCRNCRILLHIHTVYVATAYEGIYEQLIHAMKFDCKRQAAEPIAQIMSEVLKSYSNDTNYLLTPLPTASSRIRQRGFDHSKLIAQSMAKELGTESQSLLGRFSNVRQLGSNRTKRFQQMEQEFYTINDELIKDKTILLVDDVVTTGASLSGAAKVLLNAGAKQVRAVVFAQKI